MGSVTCCPSVSMAIFLAVPLTRAEPRGTAAMPGDGESIR